MQLKLKIYQLQHNVSVVHLRESVCRKPALYWGQTRQIKGRHYQRAPQCASISNCTTPGKQAVQIATQNALRKIEEHEKGVCIQFVKSVSLDLMKRSFFSGDSAFNKPWMSVDTLMQFLLTGTLLAQNRSIRISIYSLHTNILVHAHVHILKKTKKRRRRIRKQKLQ